MKIIVGLGNPGRRYEGTRHNVGFAVIDALAAGDRFQHRFQAEVVEHRDEGQTLLLAKPDTFMNLSGQSVRQLVDYYRCPLEDLLIVCDDMNLPLGKLRIRARGSHGGHNGLRDIESRLGTTAYPRLRIGVGSPLDADAVEHVLGRFRPSEQPVIEEAIHRAARAVLVWARHGIDVCMNQYNG
ncbi:MAG: aminoacyl-tRNA hydrolase [Gemmataceae bacterium]|nr:aminoacyl-tRNA hydrolase [Gemmataceae bacterium]MDW8264652.1 aminoacyl-tRNA hydrolase [Gemmataceae bacterium]